ncbi:MAG: chloride channel protein [Anaerolineae bacterium]|nr:chloride channel protein [Anaerolineae bacterium]
MVSYQDGQSSTPVYSAFSRALYRMMANVNLQSFTALITLAIIVGTATGGAAVVFIKLIGWITHISFEQGLPHLLASSGSGWVVIVPILGALISGPMIAYWAIEAKGHGVPEVMQAIIMENGRTRPRVAVVKSLTSAVLLYTKYGTA